jgi:2-polyprenylphenol 6-hydroxylase
LNTDVIIIGAGIVGLTTALALSQNMPRLQIVILDTAQAPDFSAKKNQQVSAISQASQQIFAQLDIWNNMELHALSPCHFMEIWEEKENSRIHFSAKASGLPVLAYIVRNHLLQKMLLQKIAEKKEITLLYSAAPSVLSIKENQIELTTTHSEINSAKTSEKKWHAQLLIGADGAHSFVRQAGNFLIKKKSYAQHAIVATVKTTISHQCTAFQRFLTTGPLAFLPLADPHLSSIVWSIDDENNKETDSAQMLFSLAEFEKEKFAQLLSQKIENKLGAMSLISEPCFFPLQKIWSGQLVQHRIALVGDAAHVIHPLAGQGLNLGIADAAGLARIVADANLRGRDWGALHTLRKYERDRKAHIIAMMTAMDFFHAVFSGSSPVLLRKWVSKGMNCVNQFALLKKMLTQAAVTGSFGMI